LARKEPDAIIIATRSVSLSLALALALVGWQAASQCRREHTGMGSEAAVRRSVSDFVVHNAHVPVIRL